MSQKSFYLIGHYAISGFGWTYLYNVLGNFGRKINAFKNFRGDKMLDLISVLGHRGNELDVKNSCNVIKLK